MFYIGFDIATKSLSIVIIKYDGNDVFNLINEEINSYRKLTCAPQQKSKNYIKLLKKCNDILDNQYEIKYLDVIDLTPDKKIKDTNTIEKTLCLEHFLRNTITPILMKIPEEERTFIIEYQMGPNDKSRVISSQIMFYCSLFCCKKLQRAQEQIKLIGPALKNKLYITDDEKSFHSYHLGKYKTNYAANKNHTKYLLKTFLGVRGRGHILKKISKKNLDDAADAFCMIIAYIKNTHDYSQISASK